MYAERNRSTLYLPVGLQWLYIVVDILIFLMQFILKMNLTKIFELFKFHFLKLLCWNLIW